VWVIAEGSDPSSLATVQPLEDLQLEGPSEALDADESTGEILAQDEMEVESEDEMGDAKDADEDVEMDDDDDDDADEAYGSVIPQQFLTEIFDAAPAFAAPSIEDMFYKVTGLLATKPLAGQQ
jgi:NET1-associated nuclear protein 1 (U3 small nucleolar RNA-associated protein 17)